MRFDRRGVCISIVLAFAVEGLAAQSPGFPTRPIRIVVATPPGGANDGVARIVGQKLAEGLRQAVVVENRPGAAQMIGAEVVAKSAPDGHTLLLATQTALAVVPVLYRSVPYDPVKDFAPIAMMATAPLVLVVNPSLPVRSVKELIALARAKPGDLSFASGGIGSTTHMAAALLSHMAAIQMTNISYKGEAPALTDVLGGQVPLMFSNVPAAMPFVKSGRLRALGITSAERVAMAPEIDTVSNAGLKGFEVRNSFGLVAPAGVAREVVSKLADEVKRALGAPDTRDKLETQGLIINYMGPDEFAVWIKSELDKWSKVVKQAGIRAE